MRKLFLGFLGSLFLFSNFAFAGLSFSWDTCTCYPLTVSDYESDSVMLYIKLVFGLGFLISYLIVTYFQIGIKSNIKKFFLFLSIGGIIIIVNILLLIIIFSLESYFTRFL